MDVKMELEDVSRREVLRYMGCKGEGPPEVLKLAEEALSLLWKTCEPRHEVREFSLVLGSEGEIETECFQTVSWNLSKNLAGCKGILLFAATLGIGPDHLIRRGALLDMSRALAFQAGAAAILEEYCNQVCGQLKEQYRKQGLYLRPRFSPGYGDFPLSCQPQILHGLEAGKRLGIKLTEGFLMMPSKSVTAVMGLSEIPGACAPEGCEACGKKDCPYRRDG